MATVLLWYSGSMMNVQVAHYTSKAYSHILWKLVMNITFFTMNLQGQIQVVKGGGHFIECKFIFNPNKVVASLFAEINCLKYFLERYL